MPSKNSIKSYIADSYYHIYNRGVEKRKIFEDDQDYHKFLSYLEEALNPPKPTKDLLTEFTLKGQSFKGVRRQPKNFNSEIELLCYCLMPNHLHLLIHQKNSDSLEYFTRSILTRYSIYFNKKYNRVGHLFQGRYKAKLILKDEYLLHLSRYIHKNPGKYFTHLKDAYSSYPEYLGYRKTSWTKTEKILPFFNKSLAREFLKTNSYKKFVEGTGDDSKDILGSLILEDD